MNIYKANPSLPEVALIFDDGPNPVVTPLLLDILREHNVRATFFLIGARAEEYPQIALRIAQEGHEIGNHTYSHKRLTRILEDKGESAVKEELEKGAAAIQKAANLGPQDIRFLRPPYLDWSPELADIASPSYQDRIIMAGLAAADYDWGVDHYWDANDTAAITAQSQQIVHAWQAELSNGKILAFHDSSEHNLPGNAHYDTWQNRALPTLRAIPQLIDLLQAKGFVIKKLSDMKLVSENAPH